LERREVLRPPQRFGPRKSAKAESSPCRPPIAPTGRTVYPAEKARQGEIVLRRPWQRMVFIGGLAGCGLLVLILWFWMAVS
jgi:hypothetical protein